MNNINNTTFFDYLDGLLSPEDKKEFENYIANNPEAKSKLDKLIQEEKSYYNKVDSGEFEKITDKYSFEINKLQEVINKQHKKEPKKNNLLDFVQKMFKPLWEIPIQAKGVVALPVAMCVYLFVTTFVPMQSYQNQLDVMNYKLAKLETYKEETEETNQIAVSLKKENKELRYELNNLLSKNKEIVVASAAPSQKKENDTLMQMASFISSDFLSNSKYGDRTILTELNGKPWTIEDITTNFKTRSAAQASNLTCDSDLDSKIIEIFPSDNPLSKRTLTYCGITDKNNWRLLNIEIQKDKKPLKLNSNYKLVFEKDSIFLFPEDTE
jgi:hypothetical protein